MPHAQKLRAHKWSVLPVALLCLAAIVPASREVLRIQLAQVVPLSPSLIVSRCSGAYDKLGMYAHPEVRVRYSWLRRAMGRRGDAGSQIGLVYCLLGQYVGFERMGQPCRGVSWHAATDEALGREWRALAAQAPSDARTWILRALIDVRRTHIQRGAERGALSLASVRVPVPTEDPHGDPQRRRRRIATALKHVSSGARLEPENSLWDYTRAYFLFADRRDEEALAAVREGAGKRAYAPRDDELHRGAQRLLRRAGAMAAERSHRWDDLFLGCIAWQLLPVAEMVTYHALVSESSGDHARAAALYRYVLSMARQFHAVESRRGDRLVAAEMASLAWRPRACLVSAPTARSHAPRPSQKVRVHSLDRYLQVHLADGVIPDLDEALRWTETAGRLESDAWAMLYRPSPAALLSGVLMFVQAFVLAQTLGVTALLAGVWIVGRLRYAKRMPGPSPVLAPSILQTAFLVAVAAVAGASAGLGLLSYDETGVWEAIRVVPVAVVAAAVIPLSLLSLDRFRPSTRSRLWLPWLPWAALSTLLAMGALGLSVDLWHQMRFARVVTDDYGRWCIVTCAVVLFALVMISALWWVCLRRTLAPSPRAFLPSLWSGMLCGLRRMLSLYVVLYCALMLAVAPLRLRVDRSLQRILTVETVEHSVASPESANHRHTTSKQ